MAVQEEALRRKEAEEREEAARRKAMILQYVEAWEDEAGSSEEDVAGDEAVEDWELTMWADPREVERRRAERVHAKLPPDVRRAQASEK